MKVCNKRKFYNQPLNKKWRNDNEQRNDKNTMARIFPEYFDSEYQ